MKFSQMPLPTLPHRRCNNCRSLIEDEDYCAYCGMSRSMSAQKGQADLRRLAVGIGSGLTAVVVVAVLGILVMSAYALDHGATGSTASTARTILLVFSGCGVLVGTVMFVGIFVMITQCAFDDPNN